MEHLGQAGQIYLKPRSLGSTPQALEDGGDGLLSGVLGPSDRSQPRRGA